MPQIINIPGVGEVSFPDGMSDQAISNAIEQDILKAPTTSKGPEIVKEIGRVADKSIRGGLLAVPELMAMLAKGARKGGEWAAGKLGARSEDMATPSKLESFPDAVKVMTGGEVAVPQTTVGKHLGSIGQTATAMLAGPGGLTNIPKNLAIGAASGEGSELAAMLGDNALTRFAGGLLGGGATAAYQTYKTNNIDKVARAMFDGVSKSDITEALAVQAKADKAGLPLNLGQALGRETGVDAVIDSLASSPEGKNTVNLLRAQPLHIKLGTQTAVQGLPGSARATRDIANRSQEAASSLIKDGLKKAGEVWTAMAPVGATIPENGMKTFDSFLTALAAKYPNTARAEMVNDVKAAIRNQTPAAKPSGLLDAAGKPIPAPVKNPYLEDALQVKGAIDDVLQNFGARKLNTPGTAGKELQTAQVIREAFSKEGGVLETFAPGLVQANRAYEAVMSGTVNPLKKSVIGDLAGRTGSSIDANAPQGKLLKILDNGTQPGVTRSEILTTARNLNKQDPSVFLDAGKTWITSKLDKALNSPGARDSTGMAASVLKAFGTPQKTSAQTQGLADILAGMAEAQNLPPETLQALPKFLQYVGMAVERPSTTGGMTATNIGGMEGASAVGRLGHVSTITMLRQPILSYTDMLGRNTRKEIDRLLSSPEGIKMLYTLGQTSPWSAAGQAAMKTFFASTVAAQGTPKPTGIIPE